MTECFQTEFKEKLPELAAGTLQYPAQVEAHVTECAHCSAELKIIRAVRQSAVPAPYINVAKIVRALPPAPIPAREEKPWYRRASLQMAAAFLLVVGGAYSVRQAGDRVAASRSDIALVAGLDELSTAELTILLQDVDELAAVPVDEPVEFSPVNANDAKGEG